MKPPTTEHPILFMAPMVRALLAKKKRVTRRPVKWPKWLDPSEYERAAALLSQGKVVSFCVDGRPTNTMPRPYGDAGHTLWVKETWAPMRLSYDSETGTVDDYHTIHPIPKTDPRTKATVSSLHPSRPSVNLWYRASIEDEDVFKEQSDCRWYPSIFCARWASRLTLPVTKVHVERLSEITHEEVELEGFHHADLGTHPGHFTKLFRRMHSFTESANPFVWVVHFDDAKELK